MNPLISVVVPTFKRPDKLRRALKSVLAQSFTDYEVIVVNDDEEEIELKINDSRIQIIKNQREKGGNGSRNTGVLNSKGQYVAFLDDDDEWRPDYLQKKLSILKRKPINVGMVYGGFSLEKNGKWIEIIQKEDGNLLDSLLTSRFWVGSSSNIFLRREVIEKVGLWDESLQRQQDLEFLVRVFSSYNVAFESTSILRVYGHNEPNPQKAFEAREKFNERIEKYLQQLSERSRNKYFSDHFRRQSKYLVESGFYKNGFQFWKKSTKYQIISFKADYRIIRGFLRSIF